MNLQDRTDRPGQPPTGILRTFSIVLIAIAFAGTVRADSDSLFELVPIEIATYKLFDVGVADLNQDGSLDLYTTNCYARPSVLVRSESGYRETFDESGLHFDPAFPGLSDQDERPSMDKPGYYIFWFQGKLMIESNVEQGELTGRLQFESDFLQSRGKEYLQETRDYGRREFAVDFQLPPGKSIGLRPIYKERSITFTMDRSIPLGSLMIGRPATNPTSHRFTTRLMDRHALVLADDLFFQQGGLKNAIEIPAGHALVERFTLTDSIFQAVPFDMPWEGMMCPGRRASWVDYNGDGTLDYFVACAHQATHRLFKGLTGGSFEDVTEECGLNVTGGAMHAWVDWDSDGDADYFVASKEALTFWQNRRGHFEVEWQDSNSCGIPEQLAFGDADRDGDLDLFIPGGQVSAFLRNDSETWSMIRPASIGLPEKSKHASWVDFDNDGDLDLHTVPQGIYERVGPGSYTPTNLLKMKDSISLTKVRATWFDTDSNGTMDLLLAVDRGNLDWLALLGLNHTGGNHWIQVDLKGPPGNRRAIGAACLLHADGRVDRRDVGIHEGAKYSQGHYRLYFGLGACSEADSLEVFWSGGPRQVVHRPDTDRLLTLQYSDE